MIWFFVFLTSILLFLAPGTGMAIDLETPCTRLTDITLTENKLFPEEEQKQQLSTFIGQCISPKLLNDLLATISTFYQRQGFITTRAYLQAQDISQGQVVVSVLIGRTGKVLLVSDEISDRRVLALFPGSDEILDLSRLERAIETIERVPSANASFSLLPGDQPGTSDIEVTIVDDIPWGLEAGALVRSDDNADLIFSFRLDNPLQLNDILWFRNNTGQVATSAASSNGSEIEYTLPLQSTLLTLSARDFSFKQAVQGQNGSYLSTGETQTFSANWSVPLSANREHQWTIAALFTSERSRSFFENEPVEVSSYDSREWGFSLGYQSSPAASISIDIKFQYLIGEGDTDDDYFTGTEGFDSTADVNATRQLLSADLRVPTVNSMQWLQLGFSGQSASDLLRQNRKLSLGSFNTVRGYQGALSGSEGWSVNIDYFWAWSDSLGKSLRLNLGLDYGETTCEIDNQDICGDIYGAGFGWALFDANFSAQLLAGFPLKDLSQSDADEQQVALNLMWRL